MRETNHIAVMLPPTARWLPLLRDGIARYAKTVGFSKALEDRILYSVTEACEELIRISEQARVFEPFNVFLDFKGEAAIIEIEYSSRIPLNPYETEEYEIPDAATNLDDINVDALWLFMIKKQMDRVFFKVRGKRRILSMMQYRREPGMEKRVWAMSIRPKLSRGLDLHLKEEGIEHPGSVLQKGSGGALMLGPSETFFIRNMDGVKSFHDLYMAHVDAIGLVSPNLPVALYEKLESMGMLDIDRDDTRKKRFKAFFSKLINPSFSIPKADQVVTAVHRGTRFFFTPLGAALLMLVGLSGLIPLWRSYPLMLDRIAGLEQTLMHAPYMLIFLYVMTLVHVSLHELAHGVTCKHFGGKVSRMGIMFYLASFIFFCDTTAAYTFPKKRQRILVSLSGPLVSFAVFGMGLWGAGYFAGSNTMWEDIFVAFSLFNFFGLVMNLNPFIKMDAYYMLLDVTGTVNLREKSFRFLKRKLGGWLGFGSAEDIKVGAREKRLFWWYGLLGSAMTVLFIAAPVARLGHLLKTQSLAGGRAMLAIAGGALLLARLGAQAFERMRGIFYREHKLK